jgi:nitroreductase
MENKKLQADAERMFGCMACGQCLAVCPRGAIHVEGRELRSEDVVAIPPRETRASYEELYKLMLARRSVRHYKEQKVERAVIAQIIEAVTTAPMGIPPSDVQILVLDGKEKVAEFAQDMTAVWQQTRWMFAPWTWPLWRVLMGKEMVEMLRTFIYPLINFLLEKRARGEDWLFYHAPLAMYFHTSPYSDPVDPLIAATYAMLAAESLGLGSCMIGSIAPFIKSGATKLKDKYHIPRKNQQGLMLILGYPDINYIHAIKRTVAKVDFY